MKRAERSIGWRVLASVLLGELVFSIVLALTIGTFSTLTLIDQNSAAARQTAAVIAAALMPTIADQEEARVSIQLESVVEASNLNNIECVHVTDASGATIASYGDAAACAVVLDEERPATPWSRLFDTQLVRQPVAVDGMQVAMISIRFSPPALSGILTPATMATLLVLVSVMLVSVPWTLWFVVKDLVEPLQEIERYASSVAEGRRDLELPVSRPGEIGHLQEVLAHMARQLERREQEIMGSYAALREAYDSLDRAKRELEQLSRVKANFVAVAAHEIRGPVQQIRLYSELLDTGEIGDMDEATAEAAAAIHSAASRLSSITYDLMDSALVERGLLPLQFADVALDSVLHETVRDAGAMAAASRIELQLEDVESVTLRGDAIRLRQVLDNLVSNAIKYSPSGTRVTVRGFREGDDVIVEVADRGHGISQRDSAQLFKLFGRLDFSDNRETAGLGLGLAISARIVEAHGGTISFRANEGGQGSVFTVRLPMSGSTSEPSTWVVLDAASGGGHS